MEKQIQDCLAYPAIDTVVVEENNTVDLGTRLEKVDKKVDKRVDRVVLKGVHPEDMNRLILKKL